MTEPTADPELDLEIGILGPVLVLQSGREVQISRGTPSLVLSALTAQAGPVSTSELVDTIGQARGRSVTVATIHTAIWRLRSRVGEDAIVASEDGYSLDRRRCRVDADRFVDLVERARELLDVGQPGVAASSFEGALALWRGAPFGELGDAHAGLVARRRLIELRAVTIEELAVALRAAGRPREAVPVLEGLVGDHALREHAWALLVGAYLEDGRVDEARAAYDRARLVLAEFGVSPGRELEAAIRPADTLARSMPAAERMAPLPPLVSLARRTPLVGRTDELAALRAVTEDALADAGAAFVPLTGAAGVGKTRLAAEIAAIAHERGAAIWFEICDSSAISPLTPLGDWARAVVSAMPESDVADLTTGALAPLLRPDTVTGQTDVDRDRLLRFEAIAELFSRVRSPAVLVLDDAHNAPTDTVHCLNHVLRTRPHLPLAIIATIRPAAIAEGTSAAWDGLRRLPSVRPDLSVADLGPADAAAMFADLAGPAGLGADEASRRLLEATGGNPALIAAIAASPTDLGTIREAAAAPGDVGTVLEATVRGMSGQLDAADRTVLELVAVAAFVRPIVGTGTIASAVRHLGEPGIDAASAMRAAATAGLVVTDDQLDTLLFRHEMVRDVVYATIPAARRRALHLATARAVEQIFTGEAMDIDALAEHYERAWPDCRADEMAPHALRAATHALSLLDVDRAIALAQRAVSQLAAEPDRGSARAHGQLLILLAGALAETGDVKAAVEAYRQAADLAEAHGWIDLEAIAHTHALQMRSSRPRSDDPDITGLRRVIDTAPDLDDAMLAEGLIYLLAVDPDGSTAPVDRLLAAAEARGDDRLQLKIIQELTWSTPLEHRARYQADYAAVAARLGEPGPLARTQLHAWMADIEHGRSRFDLPWEPIGRLVREAREPLLTYDWRLWRATTSTNQGAWDEAGRLIEAARTTRFAQPLSGSWLQERPSYISAVHAVQLGSILYERGEMELLHAVGSQFPIDVLIRCSVDSRSMRARAAAEIGHPSATELCDELIDEPYVDGPKTADWLATMTYLASACGVCGHRRGSELCLELLTPYIDRHTLVSWTQYIGAVRHNVSFIHVLLDDLDAADDDLRIATSQYDAMAARPFAAIARFHHADVLTKRGRPADRREAELLRAQALTEATALEMSGFLRSHGT